LVNLVLLALIVCFGVWEVLAGFMTRGVFSPMTTVSEYVWALEDYLGLTGRVLVGVACLALFSHLVLRWPLGP
jgi:hypothetical protein